MNPSELGLPLSAAPVPVERASLTLLLRDAETGAAVGFEPVRLDDLADHMAETWRESCLRQHHPELSLSELSFNVRPLLKTDHGPACHGFLLEPSPPAPTSLSVPFTAHSLRAVATRAAERFIGCGQLKRGQLYSYEVQFRPEPERPAGSAPVLSDTASPPLEFDTCDRSPTLNWLEVPRRSLLARATAFPAGNAEAFQVFFVSSAFARAEHFARKGGSTTPPVETGAVLLGALCSCPESGDFFVVVTDAHEVLGAEQKAFSLNYTDQSWLRIQALLGARQAVTPALRLVGQAHGHNFLPGNGQTCAACPALPVCDLTNVYASEDDQLWTKATFAGAPCALCFIFGLSARGDRVHGLFTPHDARLRQRGYYVLPDFHPESWPCRSACRTPVSA
jgi:hypothetical protein